MKFIVKYGNKLVVVLVDACDYHRLGAHKWRIVDVGGKLYAITSVGKGKGRRPVYMHRLIMDAPSGVQVDHINGNGLDNRRCNLRLCTPSQNAANRKVLPLGKSSQYRGVHWDPRKHKHVAEIKLGKKTKHLGYFDSEEAAAVAYNLAAKDIFGDFAQLNVLREADESTEDIEQAA